MTIKELNDEYIRLAGSEDNIQKEYESIRDYNMNKSTAIYHNEYVRTTYVPKIFRRSDFDAFTRDISILYNIFDKIIEKFCEDSEYRSLFGLSALENELILTGRRDIALLPMLRVDFFYNEETGEYKFCEFNTDGTSAMNEDRELHNAQNHSETYHKFNEAFPTSKCELFDSWVDAVLSIYNKAKLLGKLNDDFPAIYPHIAIVDYLEFGLVHEFKHFCDCFNSRGISCEVCDVRDLKYDGHNLTGPSGKRIDVIYRRAVTSDVLNHLEESSALLNARNDGNVILLGDFHTQIIHNKAIFRMLQHEKTYELLTQDEIDYLKAHVPVTKFFTDADRDVVAANRENWILKPLDSYGSRGLYAGVEYTDEEWPQIVAGVPTEGYIMQEFQMPYITENYGDDKGIFGKYKYYNLTGIYVYDSVPTGVYSRVSLSPIISTQYSEKTLPTLIVEDC